jgi:type I restriction enzyme M protein
MVHLLFYQDDALLSKPGTIRKLLDPTCGTGGMLAVAQEYLRNHHEQAALYVYGQDYNKRSYAVAYSDLLIKGHENSRVEYGDTLLPDEDRFKDHRFDYFLANPPFGVDWKKQQKEVKAEHDKQGFAGRFGAGLPRVNDGSLLFLQHMIAKFEPVQPGEQKHGSRLAIVFNGSPLFTGGAGSGESDIRKWIIENDWLEAIVALPEQMFYNTGIGTYVWLVTNRKAPARRGKIQLIDARARWTPMRRSLGQKRRQIGDDDIAAIVREYGDLDASATSRVFANADFGYRRVTVERPLRLRFRIDTERKARFLEGWPHLLDDVQAIDKSLGRDARLDWNEVEAQIKKLLRSLDSSWRAPDWKAFREVFTDTDPAAAPVIAKSGPLRENGHPASPDETDRIYGHFLDPAGKAKKIFQYEPDSKLRDFENIPLTEDVVAYFKREVLPHVPDAWIDDEKTKVGYEINFNRHFYRYTPPRPLAEIDADLKAAEAEILRLLGDVTHAAPASSP